MRRSAWSRWSERRWTAAVAAVVVLAVGLTITATATAYVARAEREAHETRFRADAEQAAQATQDHVTTYLERLRNIGAFLGSGRPTTDEQLARYLATDDLFADLPSLDGLLYVEPVPEDEIEAYVSEGRSANPDLALDLTMGHSPGRPYYLVTHYVAGTTDLQLATGSDLSPVPTLRFLVERSAATGDAIVAGFQNDPLVRAVVESGTYPAADALFALDFFIAVPVFDGTGLVGADHLVGWIGGPVAQFETVLGSGQDWSGSIGVALSVDVDSPGVPGAEAVRATATAGPEPAEVAGLRLTHTFEVMGVEFVLTAWPGDVADPSPSRTVPLVALGGLGSALLGAAVALLRVRANQGRRDFALAIADRSQIEHDLIESVNNALVVLDHDGRVVMGNRRWVSLVGTPRSGPAAAPAGAGPPYLRSLPVAAAGPARDLAANLADVLDGRADVADLDVPVTTGDGDRWLTVRITPLGSREGGAVVVHTDVTERRRSTEALHRQARRDGLTGLLNRAAFEEELDAVLARAEPGAPVALLFVDLDDFKAVNDRLGHAVGDAVLQATASAIEANIRAEDRAGRRGGDEFVVLLAPPVDEHEARMVAGRIVADLGRRRLLGTERLAIAASVGLAHVRCEPGTTRRDLLDRADEAMYEAKRRGGGRYVDAAVFGGR